MNATAALLAAQELGANIKTACEALSNFAALKGRGARFTAGGIDIIDEATTPIPLP